MEDEVKDILGHKSWNMEEIIDMLKKSGTFSMCNLPHYRFNGVKTICRCLQRRGFIKKTGNGETFITFGVTERFVEWKNEYEAKITTSLPVKWQKLKYPITQGNRITRGCR